MGAAYGTSKSGVGVASMGVMRPGLLMKSIVLVVMAGVLGIYGLIIVAIISTDWECELIFQKLNVLCMPFVNITPVTIYLIALAGFVVVSIAGSFAALESFFHHQV
ncbi:hypothetical protein MKW94_024124 [Papaver nudicaule]|uniref:V-type proton ATPase proteolipid subunit n=1 Tax=Papaver nudicaule TaxID=74823 RepID=A0AA41VXE6_PAPNU|nr:hypothetical protein [Papaver nudicaule]